MPSPWMSLRVELLAGRGEELWPAPGRLIAFTAEHTFADLAEAIDLAFGRWDTSPARRFTLADGTTLESRVAAGGDYDGVLALVRDSLAEPVRARIGSGARFRYVFDPERRWVHRCTVDTDPIDPVAVRGGVPERPTTYAGWGDVPDQHGRRWDGDGPGRRVPERPAHPDPMTLEDWPRVGDRPLPLDGRELRGALARAGGADGPDLDAVLTALRERDISASLQLAGGALLAALDVRREGLDDLVADCVARLRTRAWDGDAELAEDLVRAARDEATTATVLPLALDEVASLLDDDQCHGGDHAAGARSSHTRTDPCENEGGFVDRQTGEVVPAFFTDAVLVGDELVIDVDEDPDRWVRIYCEGSRAGWADMVDFAATLDDERLRRRLESALAGRGASRRFRSIVQDAGVGERWQVFSEERSNGRARAHLADLGIRARPQTPAPPRKA